MNFLRLVLTLLSPCLIVFYVFYLSAGKYYSTTFMVLEVIPLYLIFIYTLFCRFRYFFCKKNDSLLKSYVFIRKWNLHFLFSLTGYSIVLLGSFLLREDWFLTDFFGALILVVGYQVVFWAVEVKSELIGNKVVKIDRKQPFIEN